MRKVDDMEVGTEATYGDVCSMLGQLQSLIDDDAAPSHSLVDRVDSVVSKLPSASPLHRHWLNTQSQYHQVTDLINRRRSDWNEARARLAPDEKVSAVNRRSSAASSRRSTARPLSDAGNYTPPVCHVKPTPVSSEPSARPSTAPFDVRTYLIDKNAPVAEPVFRPPVTSRVQDDAANSSEVTQRHSSADNLPTVESRCMRPVSEPASGPAASAVPTTQSRWKTLKKKAFGLLSDGCSPSHSQRCSPRRQLTASSGGINSFPRCSAAAVRTVLMSYLIYCWPAYT